MSNRRKAFSLLEFISVMSIGMVLVGIASTMLVGLLRAERTSRLGRQYESAAYRLGEQFRRDMRSASTVENSGQGKWLLRLSKRESVTYESLPGEILRAHRKADGETSRESYIIWPGATAELKVEVAATGPQAKEKDISFAILAITAEHEREVVFEAPLGADNRFINDFPPGE